MEEYKAHKEILDIFVDVFDLINDPTNRKMTMLEANAAIDEIQWFGLPIIFNNLFKDLSGESDDPKLYGVVVRLIAPFYQERAREIANELEARIEELGKWSYDKAVGFTFAGAGILPMDKEKAKKFLDKALKFAYDAPDRSDRSIALCDLLPILHQAGMTDRIPQAFDEIVYRPKKVEASKRLAEIENIDSMILKKVFKSLSPSKRKLMYAVRGKTLSHTDKDQAETFCKKALNDIDDGIDAAKIKKEAFEAYQNIGKEEQASEILQDLSPLLVQNINKRPYATILMDLINILIQEGKKKEGISLLGKVKEQTGKLSPADRLFILNKSANLLAENLLFQKSAETYQAALNVLGGLDELSLQSSVISVGISLLSTLNHFPQDFPEEVLKKTVDKIRPIGKRQLEIGISEDNLEYLKEVRLDKTLGEKIDELILADRRRGRLGIDEEIHALLNKLIAKKTDLVVTYLLKYVHSISIHEKERSTLISLISKAGNQLAKGKTKRAESYVKLAVSKLSEMQIPLSPVVIKLVDQYFLKVL